MLCWPMEETSGFKTEEGKPAYARSRAAITEIPSSLNEGMSKPWQGSSRYTSQDSLM